jgi:hypothetical protein
MAYEFLRLRLHRHKENFLDNENFLERQPKLREADLSGAKARWIKTIFFALFSLGFLLNQAFTAPAQKAFTLGTLQAEPGKIVSGWLEVPPGQDSGTRLPVTIINGLKPGKVLAVISGVHPYEYPPILASYRLKKRLDPKRNFWNPGPCPYCPSSCFSAKNHLLQSPRLEKSQSSFPG